MEKKHLGLGLLLGFGLMTYFLIELRLAQKNQARLEKEFIGTINGQSVHLSQIEKELNQSLSNFKNLEDYFNYYVNHKLIEWEAKKIGASTEEYLSFFNYLRQLHPSPEEIKHFKDWESQKINTTRPERAKKALLRNLRKQNNISFHSKTSTN